MFDHGKESLTPESILRYISDWDIIKYYVPDARLDRHFFTPFGKEKLASASIANFGGKLYLKDFGSTKKAVDCFGLVCDIFNLRFNEALEKIRSDFNLTNITGGVVKKLHPTPIYRDHNIPIKTDKTISVKYREWKLYDKAFWLDRYGITLSTLQKFGVSPISNFWINGSLFYADKLSYLYYYFKSSDQRDIVKIYQPDSKKVKWISNSGHLQVIQGEGMLPLSGNLLIITKSLKDIMVLYEMGYTAVAPQAESVFLNEKYYRKQRDRFEKIVLFFDNDRAGVKLSQNFSKQYSLLKITIPSYYYNYHEITDISDYVDYYGFEAGRDLIQKLLLDV